MRPLSNLASASGRARLALGLREIDGLIQNAGLVSSLRVKSGARNTRSDRLDSTAAEELFHPAPSPFVAANGVEWLAASGWERIPWLWHGFSTRRGGLSRAYCVEDAPGELNLGFTADDKRETVASNRSLLADAVTGDPATPLVAIRQFHSNLLNMASLRRRGRERPRTADGLIATEPGLLLGIQTADCIPVLVADCKRRVVAAFHAGWRGTAKRIVEIRHRSHEA